MIGKSIEIKGNLSGGEDLLVEGRIEGKIELKQHNVTVGKNGNVMADIHGRIITIEGVVHGNLFGDEQIVLRNSSTVRGNITAPRVSLEDGSNFKGSIDMTPKGEREPAAASSDSKSFGSGIARPARSESSAQAALGSLKTERGTP